MVLDLGGAVFEWLVGVVGDRALMAGEVRRRLQEAVAAAVDAVTAEVADDEARSRLRLALREHFGEAPAIAVDPGRDLYGRLEDAVRAQLAPLADPAVHPGDGSYLEQIGVDEEWLADRLTSGLVGAIRDLAALHDLGALATRLGLEELRRDLVDRTPAPPFMAPRPPAGFVPRPGLGGPLVAALTSADQEGPIILTGGGGFGKTTLAAWACHEVRASFPDGLLWAELGPRPTREWLVTVLADLAGRLTGTRPDVRTEAAASSAFAEALGDRRVLMVLDDAWRSQDVELFLAAGPRCVRLVTSRQREVVPSREIPVGSMERSEAIAVLRPDGTDLAEHDVAPLLQRLSGWPLALSLLSYPFDALHRRHGLSLAAAADELAGELDRNGLGVVDDLAAAGQERGVSSTLSVSLDQLNPAAVDRYVTIAAFPPGASVPYDLLAGLWDVTPIRARLDCDGFFDRSLLTVSGNDGVRLHDVLRELLRHRFPAALVSTSAALLDQLRPPAGWHALPDGDPLWPQLAHHLVQANRRDDLAAALRDLRFLVSRLWSAGPLALESDLRTYLPADDPLAQQLLTTVQHEAHLLLGHDRPGDVALTLYSRLFGIAADELTYVADALPTPAIIPERPLHDRASSDLVRVLTGHDGKPCSLGWHPGGDLLSISQDPPVLRRWDVTTGEQRGQVDLTTGSVRRARLSPDGRHVALVCRDDIVEGRFTRLRSTVVIVDPTTGETLARREASSGRWGTAPQVTWSPDSRQLAITDGPVVRLWSPLDDTENDPLAVEAVDGEAAAAVDWHPIGGLAVLTSRGRLGWWRDPSGAVTRWIDVSHEGRTDLERQRPEPYRLRNAIAAIAWRPDGDALAVVDEDRMLVCRPRTGVVLNWVSARFAWGGGDAVAWRRDGGAVLAVWAATEPHSLTTGKSFAEWDPESGTSVIEPSRGWADVVWHPSLDLLATAGGRPMIQLWASETTPAVPASRPDVIDIKHATWQPEGDLLLTHCLADDRQPQGVLSVVSSERPTERLWPAVPFGGMPVWSPDGQLIAHNEMPLHERPVVIRRADDGEPVSQLSLDLGWTNHVVVAWPRADRLLIYRDYYGDFVLVDADTGASIRSLSVSNVTGGNGPGFAVSGDGRRLAILPNNGIEIVDLDTGDRMQLDTQRSCYLAVFPRPDRLVGATTDELVLYDLTAPEILARTPARLVHGLAATERHVATVAAQRLRLLDAETLRPLTQMALGRDVSTCGFDHSGRRLVLTGTAGLYQFVIA